MLYDRSVNKAFPNHKRCCLALKKAWPWTFSVCSPPTFWWLAPPMNLMPLNNPSWFVFVFQYLEKRFSPVVRLFGCILFILQSVSQPIIFWLTYRRAASLTLATSLLKVSDIPVLSEHCLINIFSFLLRITKINHTFSKLGDLDLFRIGVIQNPLVIS